MFLGELEDHGRVPANGVLCLLCRQKVMLHDGDLTPLEQHLDGSHSVTSNVRWIIDCTLRSQNRTGLLRNQEYLTSEDDSKTDLSEDFSYSNRRKRGRRKTSKVEPSKKKVKIEETVTVEEEDEEDVVSDLSSSRIKRCDIRIKVEDFTIYLKDLGIEKPRPNVPPEEKSEEKTSAEILCDDKKETSSNEETKGLDKLVTNDEHQVVTEKDCSEEEDSGFEWYAGVTFTCLVCNYQSKVERSLEKHLESQHSCDIKEPPKKYKVTTVKYPCKICGSKVRHDKRSIESHVQSHFLSFTKYAQLYEQKITEKRKKLKEKKELEEAPSNSFTGSTPAVETEIKDLPSSTDHIVEENESRNVLPPTIPCETKETSVTEFLGNGLETPEQSPDQNDGVGAEDPLSITIAEVNEVIHSMLSEEANKPKSLDSLLLPATPTSEPAVLEQDLLRSPFPKTSDDVYIYCCPFQGCHYTCNFQQVKLGPAASHCKQEHNMEPWEFKMKGLKWKRVTLMSQMERMFDE